MSRSTALGIRLAKPLPAEWREELIAQGVPKRKSIAVCRVTLEDGTVIETVIVQDGWIVLTSRERISGEFEERIEFDPREITAMEVLQTA